MAFSPTVGRGWRHASKTRWAIPGTRTRLIPGSRASIAGGEGRSRSTDASKRFPPERARAFIFTGTVMPETLALPVYQPVSVGFSNPSVSRKTARERVAFKQNSPPIISRRGIAPVVSAYPACSAPRCAGEMISVATIARSWEERGVFLIRIVILPQGEYLRKGRIRIRAPRENAVLKLQRRWRFQGDCRRGPENTPRAWDQSPPYGGQGLPPPEFAALQGDAQNQEEIPG